MSRYSAAYANPQGPGDARPTALQIVEDERLVGQCAGKVALITGATSGIGIETARALHATGAALYIAARDSNKAQKAIEDIKKGSEPNNTAPIHAIEMSLDSLESVRAAAEAFLLQSSKLNLLILNAGICCSPDEKTREGFELQFATNHLGHFLFFQLVKPTLLASTSPDLQSRVVCVSSVAHNGCEVRFDDLHFESEPYDPWLAYGQSKTANIYLANEIERRYGSKGLHPLSLHPGVIHTNIGSHMDIVGWVKTMLEEAKLEMKSIPQGAATTVYAALAKEWEGHGGKYLNNCAVEAPMPAGKTWKGGATGHAPWAYDEELASKLWDVSNRLVEFEEG